MLLHICSKYQFGIKGARMGNIVSLLRMILQLVSIEEVSLAQTWSHICLSLLLLALQLVARLDTGLGAGLCWWEITPQPTSREGVIQSFLFQTRHNCRVSNRNRLNCQLKLKWSLRQRCATNWKENCETTYTDKCETNYKKECQTTFVTDYRTTCNTEYEDQCSTIYEAK